MVWHGTSRTQDEGANAMPDIQRFGPARDGRKFPPLSLAVRHGSTLHVSGVAPFDAQGGIAVGDFAAQFAQVMTNLHAVLAEAGADLTRVVKTTVLLTRAGDIREMNRLYAAAFPAEHLPARTTCVVAALPVAEFLLEIECIAALD
jgi:reactive intermediate/imine deaminase